MDLALLLVALLAGLVVGWLAGRSRSQSDPAAARAAVEAAREEASRLGERLIAVERDLASAQATLTAERAALAERLAAERAALAERLAAERVTAAQRLEAVERHAAETVAAERRTSLEKQELLVATQEKLKEQFRALSSQALETSNKQFLELAEGRLKQVGTPITETLVKVEQQLRDMETERTRQQAVLGAQIEQVKLTGERLKTETTALVSALRRPEARGRWGELQLRRVLEVAGMTDRCDFEEQVSITTVDGRLRPDVTVRLVGDKRVVIDSKVSLAAYLEAHETDDEAHRAERLDAHARHLRKHVDDLAAKAYWQQFDTAPEFVVLFVPGEAFLAPALERDRELLEHAFDKRVHIATPTTLISLLRTIAYGWQQEALTANAAAVLSLGKELYSRLGTFGAALGGVGRALTTATTSYNKAVGSLEGRVLVSARKLAELELVDGALDAPAAVEEPARALSAGELLEAATPSRPQLLPPVPLQGDDGAARAAG